MAPGRPLLTPQELVARGEAPVKREFVRESQRVKVEAVTGSLAATAAGEPAKRKSRNQMKKERQQQRKAGLCNMLIQGNCSFGSSCRFSHDVAAYLESKAPDLPGVCPFDSTGSCPYGISCRWASKHRHEDPLGREFLAAQQAQQALQAQQAQQGAGGSTDAIAAAGTAGDAPAAMVTEEVVGALAAGAEAKQTQQEGASAREAEAQQAEGAQQAQQAAGAQQVQWWWRGDGTIPPNSVGVLMPEGPIQAELNALDKALQSKLRAEEYDFSLADATLESMGLTNSRAKQRQQQRQARRGQQAQQGQQGTAGAKRGMQQGAQQGGVAGEGRGLREQLAGDGDGTIKSTANGTEAGADLADGEPACKRPRLVGGEASAGCEVGGEALGGALGGAERPAAAGGGGPTARAEGATAGPKAGGEAGAAGAAEAEAGAAGGEVEMAAVAPGEGQAGPGAQQAQQAQQAAQQGEKPTEAASTDAAFLSGLTAPTEEQGGPSPAAAAEQGGGDYVETKSHPREKKTIDFTDKLYLAPLTTVGNLPFRRLCKGLGADVTCGEMALATNLLQGQASEWALLKRHPSEDCFGVQVCGGYPDTMTRCAQLLEDHCSCDFVDINFGCPIDVVCSKGGGSAALLKPQRMEQIVRGMSSVLSMPLTFKMRKGYNDGQDIAHTLIPKAKGWGATAITLHGRTREQRYSKLADWDYIHKCAALAPEGLQLVGNGDCFSPDDYYRCLEGGPEGRKLAAIYIARGALIKPWIFTEIKERRLWDISAGERFDMLRKFCGMGLEHWGSDSRGVESTRRFLLEWLSFTYRYVPVGLLEVLPQQLNWRPPPFVGRSDLETLLASDNAADWVKISEMLLGPAPPGFVFTPKHKANSYANKRDGTYESDKGGRSDWG